MTVWPTGKRAVNQLRSARNTKHLYISRLSLLAIVYSITLVIKMRDI
jgi:hypothetical protein